MFSLNTKIFKNFIFHVTEKPNFKFVVVRMLVKTYNVRRQHDIKKHAVAHLFHSLHLIQGNGGTAICRRHIYIDLCKNGYSWRISSKRDFFHGSYGDPFSIEWLIKKKIQKQNGAPHIHACMYNALITIIISTVGVSLGKKKTKKKTPGSKLYTSERIYV